MPATATLLGGAIGLGVQLYLNAARRLPVMRHPWEHLLAIGLGSAFGNGLVKWEENVQVDLDKSIEEARNANKKRYIDCGLQCMTVVRALPSFADPVSVNYVKCPGCTFFLEDFVTSYAKMEGCLKWYMR